MQQTTYFYRRVQCGLQAANTSNTATVTVYPQVIAGTISPSGQTINYNTAPSSLSVTAATGGNGSYTYQWQSSGTSAFLTPVNVGTNSTSYTPGTLTSSTYYRVMVNSNGALVYSNYILVTVYPQLLGGSVSPASESINYNTTPPPLSVTGISGGNGSYSYQWQSATSNTFSSPSNVGINSSAYSPPILTASTYYQVIITSNGAQATSNYGTIIVYPPLQTGVISPPGQYINYNTSPAVLSVSAASGGNGTYNYQWQSCSTIGGNYHPVGSGGSSYAPGPLTTPTYYEVVTTSNGASVTSAPVLVNVYPQLIPGILTPASITLAAGTSPGVLTSTPASGGAAMAVIPINGRVLQTVLISAISAAIPV